MAGPIFDPLNPNESPATKYQREIDAMNRGCLLYTSPSPRD